MHGQEFYLLKKEETVLSCACPAWLHVGNMVACGTANPSYEWLLIESEFDEHLICCRARQKERSTQNV